MKVCGIIAEYDPFHKGHAWQIQQARELSKADFVICVMSMSFTQRGMPALLSPHDRARMALMSGADIVLGVPYAFSVCDAEKFGLGGVEILRRCGVVSALSFGVEEAGRDVFLPAAELLENPTEEYQSLLRKKLDQGMLYARAQGESLSEVLCVDANVFTLPNTSLAMCYARACLATDAGFEFVPVIRKGSYHDAQMQDEELNFSSASAVRAAVLAGNMDDVKNAMPEDAFNILSNAIIAGTYQKYQPLESLLRWRLRYDSFKGLPDLSEGIENRFCTAANAQTRDEMVQLIKTKRYTYARINRLLAHVLSQTDANDIPPKPEYAYLLGFRQRAANVLHDIGNNALMLYHRLPSGDLSPMQALDARADDLWAIGAQQPFGALHRAKPVIIKDL